MDEWLRVLSPSTQRVTLLGAICLTSSDSILILDIVFSHLVSIMPRIFYQFFILYNQYFLFQISARMLRLLYSFIAFKDRLQRYTISSFSFKCTHLNQSAAIHHGGDTSRVEQTPASELQNNQNTTLTYRSTNSIRL